MVHNYTARMASNTAQCTTVHTRDYAYCFVFFVSECDVFQARPITNDSRMPVQLLQQWRQRRLSEACTLASSGDSFSCTIKFVVIHDLRVFYCIVPKAACTSWLRVLRLTGNRAAQHVASADRHSLHVLFPFYLEELCFNSNRQLSRSPLKDYYKFTFVRKPLERLISAYRDKMFREEGFLYIRRLIIRTFRRQPSPRCIATLLYICVTFRTSPYALV